MSPPCKAASASRSPRLSIIVATWNAARTFESCIDSIAGQHFKDWELLVADGGSTDGTVNLIRQNQAHITWWQSGADSGIYDAWNQALANARGEYVCFLGADDGWLDEGVLSRLFGALGTEHYDLVSSKGVVFDPTTGRESIFGKAWNYRRIGRRMVLCHPGLLHRRTLFQQYGYFDTRYRIAGDLDFLLRLPAEIRTLHVDCISVRIEGGGISRSNVLARLREQRDVLTRCSRYGPVRAYIAWADKIWRYPIARLLNIAH